MGRTLYRLGGRRTFLVYTVYEVCRSWFIFFGEIRRGVHVSSVWFSSADACNKVLLVESLV